MAVHCPFTFTAIPMGSEAILWVVCPFPANSITALKAEYRRNDKAKQETRPLAE